MQAVRRHWPLRGGKQPRLDVAVIDKEALPGAVAARGGGADDEAAHAQLFPAAVH